MKFANVGEFVLFVDQRNIFTIVAMIDNKNEAIAHKIQNIATTKNRTTNIIVANSIFFFVHKKSPI